MLLPLRKPCSTWRSVSIQRSVFGEAESLLCLASIHPAFEPASEEHPVSDLHFGFSEWKTVPG